MKLEVKNLTKTFGEKEVLHGISFDVSGGRALGLLGRNGAGKTTTITRTVTLDTSAPNIESITITPNPVNTGATMTVKVVVK